MPNTIKVTLENVQVDAEVDYDPNEHKVCVMAMKVAGIDIKHIFRHSDIDEVCLRAIERESR